MVPGPNWALRDKEALITVHIDALAVASSTSTGSGCRTETSNLRGNGEEFGGIRH